jgi:hypothetical protein
MAEESTPATIDSIARAGIRLSTRLYTFAEVVSTGSSELKALARDVSLTSSLLDELSSHLQQDEETKLHSGSAAQTATEVLNECGVVFEEVTSVLSRATASVSKRWPKRGGKLVLAPGDRVKWPFLQPKMALLRGNLERLKATLVLMLGVLTYADEQKKYMIAPPRLSRLAR